MPTRMTAAAAGDGEVRDAVRASFARLWQSVADTAQLDPVTWSHQVRTRIKPGLFSHITTDTNR
ncbi:hypothetical protein ACWF0M_03920 [Kribbella sp. NPDC055110]